MAWPKNYYTIYVTFVLKNTLYIASFHYYALFSICALQEIAPVKLWLKVILKAKLQLLSTLENMVIEYWREGKITMSNAD